MSLEPFNLKYVKIPICSSMVPQCTHRYPPRVTPHTALPDIVPTKLYKLTENGDYLHTQINDGFVQCDLKRSITRGKILCTCFCIQPYQNTCTNQTTLEYGFSYPLFLPARQETVLNWPPIILSIWWKREMQPPTDPRGRHWHYKSAKVTELRGSCFVSSSAAGWWDCGQGTSMLINCYEIFRLKGPLKMQTWTGSFTAQPDLSGSVKRVHSASAGVWFTGVYTDCVPQDRASESKECSGK